MSKSCRIGSMDVQRGSAVTFSMALMNPGLLPMLRSRGIMKPVSLVATLPSCKCSSAMVGIRRHVMMPRSGIVFLSGVTMRVLESLGVM